MRPIDHTIHEMMLFVRQKRQEKGLSQKKLAEQLGMSQSSYARIEKVRVYPRFTTFMKILEALDIKVVMKRIDG